jgi:hypothetical protein
MELLNRSELHNLRGIDLCRQISPVHLKSGIVNEAGGFCSSLRLKIRSYLKSSQAPENITAEFMLMVEAS